MSGWRLLVLTALAGVLALLVGCLDFEEQRARIEHDQQNDRLIFIIDYRGLYEDGADTEEAERQLSEAIDNEPRPIDVFRLTHRATKSARCAR